MTISCSGSFLIFLDFENCIRLQYLLVHSRIRTVIQRETAPALPDGSHRSWLHASVRAPVSFSSTKSITIKKKYQTVRVVLNVYLATRLIKSSLFCNWSIRLSIPVRWRAGWHNAAENEAKQSLPRLQIDCVPRTNTFSYSAYLRDLNFWSSSSLRRPSLFAWEMSRDCQNWSPSLGGAFPLVIQGSASHSSEVGLTYKRR